MAQVTAGRRVRLIPATKQTGSQSGRRRGKQRVAAYCRVSTDSEEQLNSYAAQKKLLHPEDTGKSRLGDGWRVCRRRDLRHKFEKAEGIQPYDNRLQTGTD